MIKFIKLFFILVLGILLNSCSKTIYFTQDMRMNLHKNHIKLGEVQFYNSKKIALKRDISYEDTKVARGAIKLENGQLIEELIIPKNTPGVTKSETGNVINVAFESGRNRAIRFVLNDKNRYQISALVWENGYGKIVYDTLVYFIEPKSAKALLKVRKDNRYNFQKKVRKVKGLRVH